ncbi:ArsC family reductase [uncultured Cobetia sp.]|jgi:Spx/MgsR family transcriptional regulator|uniref:ArsC family reductase n=1 Tax=uncultured Cobetia sp. TaxID=410706 RepID=UPI0030EC36D1|tara:strand:- start:1640 stop:2041 length:402 start_codon:yes stop_codon:yes gene_type:complete
MTAPPSGVDWLKETAMHVLYGIKTCDTCRKARRALDDRGVPYRWHDLREDGLSASLLESWLEQTAWSSLLNKRSTSWRNLSDEQRDSLDANSARALMLEHPTLIKRPILERHPADNEMDLVIGYDKAVYEPQD